MTDYRLLAACATVFVLPILVILATYEPTPAVDPVEDLGPGPGYVLYFSSPG